MRVPGLMKGNEMLIKELREVIKNIADDYEIRNDGDIKYIPEDELVELIVDHETQRVYLIWSIPSNE